MSEEKPQTLAEENERKKTYLRSYLKAVRREKEIIEEIQRLRASKMFPPAAIGDGMPHGSGHSDLAEYAMILDEQIEKLKKERLERARLYRDIEERISEMENDNEQRVLRLKYIQGLTWEQVVEEMNYSWRSVHYLHSRALRHLRI